MFDYCKKDLTMHATRPLKKHGLMTRAQALSLEGVHSPRALFVPELPDGLFGRIALGNADAELMRTRTTMPQL